MIVTEKKHPENFSTRDFIIINRVISSQNPKLYSDEVQFTKYYSQEVQIGASKNIDPPQNVKFSYRFQRPSSISLHSSSESLYICNKKKETCKMNLIFEDVA
jgi:hypothetical protein